VSPAPLDASCAEHVPSWRFCAARELGCQHTADSLSHGKVQETCSRLARRRPASCDGKSCAPAEAGTGQQIKAAEGRAKRVSDVRIEHRARTFRRLSISFCSAPLMAVSVATLPSSCSTLRQTFNANFIDSQACATQVVPLDHGIDGRGVGISGTVA